MALSLKVENVAAAYGVVSVLHGVSLSVEEGETIALLGTNGNGKSTLLKCVTGLLRTKSGRITLELDGIAHPLERMAPHEIAALGVSMTPEGRRLFPKLTVEENLRLGAYAKTARSRIPENLDFCYQAFPVLRQRRTQIAGTMSGGQQQMLAICRSLMSSPRTPDHRRTVGGPLSAPRQRNDFEDRGAQGVAESDRPDGGAELSPGEPHCRPRVSDGPWPDRPRRAHAR